MFDDKAGMVRAPAPAPRGEGRAVRQPMAWLLRHGRLLQALVSALLLLLLAWRIDLLEAVRRLQHVDGRWLVLGAATLTLSLALQGYRWRLILAYRKRVPLGQVVLLYLVSRVVNIVVPLRGGDLVRVQIAGRRFDIPRVELAATVFAVETPLNWLVSLSLPLAALVFLDLPGIPEVVVLVPAGVLAVGAVGAILLARHGPSWDIAASRLLRRLPQRPRAVVARSVHQFITGMQSLSGPGPLGRVMVASLLVGLAEVMVYWCLGRAFGLSLALIEYVPIMLGPNLVRALPQAPGDIGAYELVVAETTMLLGADTGTAGSFAIGSHLLLLAWTGLLGLAAMWALDLRPRDLFGRRTEEPAAAGPPART
jgi:uncharacterized protein (TIRG00374 family)